MSSIKLESNSSGTGVFTIASPNSNTNRTLTLPDNTGTINTSGGVNEVPAGSVSAPSIYSTGDTNTGIFFPAADTIAFTEGGTECARITSGGNFLVGTTNDTGDGGGNEIKGNAENGGFITVKKTSSSVSGDKFMFFARNGTGVGSISLNGTSNVAYNTSSDYRLKENIAPLTSALVTIAQLKPCTWSWKSDGSNGQGFIAHELQAIVPDCVTGNKDAVDTDGKPQYQGVDTSFLVATLTAAIQELKAELDTTKARLAALEAQ